MAWARLQLALNQFRDGIDGVQAMRVNLFGPELDPERCSIKRTRLIIPTESIRPPVISGVESSTENPPATKFART